MRNFNLINNVLILLTFNFLLFTTSYAQTPSFQWVNAGGSGGFSNQYDINSKELRTDNHGNIYGISSLFNYTTQIDTVSLINGFGYEDFCVFSYRCDGSFRWVRFFGDKWADYPSGMVVDGNGNVYIAGQVAMSGTQASHYGDSTVNPTFPIQYKSTFAAKLDSSGHTVWLTIADSANDLVPEVMAGLEADNQGNINQMIKFNGATKFSGYIIPQAGVYMVKYNKINGAVMSLTKIQYEPKNFYPDYVYFSIDSDNSIYIMSDVADTIVLGNQIISVNLDTTETNTILAKLDANGQNIWVKEVKGYSSDTYLSTYKRIYGKPLILGNSIYVYGETQSFPNAMFFTYNVSNPYIISSTSKTKLIARFNKQNGAFQSAINLKNKEYMPELMVLGTRNNKILASSSATFMVINQSDTIIPQVTAAGTRYPFIVEADTALTHFNWGKATQASGFSYSYSMTTDKLGNIYLGGSAGGSISNSAGVPTTVPVAIEFFWVAKIATTNTNCVCDMVKPFPQKVGLVNKTLTVKGITSGVADSVYWIWGDGDSTLYTTMNTNISHTYQNGGNYQVCMHAYNFCGMEDSCIMVNKVNIETSEFINRELKVYPNPVNSILTIEYVDGQYLEGGLIQIYTLQGSLVKETELIKNEIRQNIDLKNLNNGMYLGRFIGKDGGNLSFKFIKE